MNNELMIPDEVIISKIYLVRQQKVMLDSDLAEMYGVETKRLNEQVKRNSDRFPHDFMFQLSQVEFENLKSQFATSSILLWNTATRYLEKENTSLFPQNLSFYNRPGNFCLHNGPLHPL